MNYYSKTFLKRLAQDKLTKDEYDLFNFWLVNLTDKEKMIFLDRFEQVHSSESENGTNYESLPLPAFPTGKAKSRSMYFVILAACLSFFVIASFVIGIILVDPNETINYQALKADRLIVLPDSSTVKLIEGGTLEVDFSKDGREVKLVGKAIFEVKKDIKRPFIVRTEELQTRVLGTKFEVKQEVRGVQVSLFTGSIQVSQNDFKQILEPSEILVYDKFSGKKSIFRSSGDQSGTVRFEDESLITVLDYMQFLYNVDFHYQEDNLKDCAISIGIGSGSLENAIELLEFAVGIKFEKNGALYHIKGTCKQL